MFYLGMNSRDDFEIIKTPSANDEVRELIMFFYKWYDICFIFNGSEVSEVFVKKDYMYSIDEKIGEWYEDYNWIWMSDLDQIDYKDKLNRLNELVSGVRD